MAIVTFDVEDFEFKDIEKIIEKIGLDFEGMKEKKILIDIPPNRPDLLDFFGIKRALMYFTGRAVPKDSYYVIKNRVETNITVSKDVLKIRPFISALVAKNLQLDKKKLSELINFTEKLTETYGRKRKKMALGLHDYDKVKGKIIYDASPTGNFLPLGSNKEMNFEEIMKHHTKGVEFENTIPKSNGKMIYPFLKDSEKILSMIPIINSKATAIDENTKNILVDITGISRKTVENTASMLVASFIDRNAEVYPVTIKYPNEEIIQPNTNYREIKVNLQDIDTALGYKFEENFLIDYANRMGYHAAKYGDSLLVKVPSYRLDVFNEQDIIEDIAIGFGYDNIKPLPVYSTSVGLPNDLSGYNNKIANFMVGLGYMEVMNNYLTNENVSFKNMLHKTSNDVVQLLYSKTENITMLRKTILPSLLQDLSRSTHEKMPQKIFEIGSVFSVEGKKVVEKINIAFASENSRVNFSEAKSTLVGLMWFLGLNYEIKEGQDPTFIEGRCANIFVGEKRVGIIGEITPKVLENFKLVEPVVACELELIGGITYFEK